MNNLKKTFVIVFLTIFFCTINNSKSLAKEKDITTNIAGENLDLINTEEIKKAQEFYEEGQLQEAIKVLEIAINKYSQAGEIIKQVYGLRNLSLIYLQLGNWQEANNKIEEAIANIHLINNHKEQEKILNLCLEIKGQLQLEIDQPELAFKTWEKSSELAYKTGDIQQFIKSKIQQIAALQEMGMYGQAVKILIEIQPKLAHLEDNLITAKAWQTIGDVLRKVGELPESESALNKGLVIAKQQQNSQSIADILISLGNVAKSKNDFEQAFSYYQEASQVTNDKSLQLQAYLSQINITVDQKSEENLATLINSVTEIINNLPPTKNLVNQRINLASNLIKIKNPQYNSVILEQLTTANQEAKTINYQRGKANALGNLGKLYQQEKRFLEAEKLIEQSLFIAQEINAPDLAYQWQWQLGQIMYQQQNREEAIVFYSQAVNSLSALRSDLVAINSDVEFNFRENVEPVYRELVDILLQPQANPPEIEQARKVIESLQIAELDNFFRDACLDVKNVDIDQINDLNTAILYPIILPDRLEVIVAFPHEPLIHYSTNLPREELTKNVQEVLDNMYEPESLIGLKKQQFRLTQEALKRWYDYLINPIAKDLQLKGLSNLVFVPDGILKSIPYAALYDGKQYLVQNYSVAIAPSLQLITPKTLTKEKIQLLAAGLSQQRPQYPELSALPGVKTELNMIQNTVTNTFILLDENFTEAKFNKQLESSPYSIVHVATHGEFSSQAEDTYLLTWEDKINLNELNSLFRQDIKQKYPIELLILSACATAVGDDRAALGLAGVALKAGARSTIASLWYVNDQATQLLMTNFYQQLTKNNQITKTEALRQAQISILENPEFDHPYYWSAFILIGNWL